MELRDLKIGCRITLFHCHTVSLFTIIRQKQGNNMAMKQYNLTLFAFPCFDQKHHSAIAFDTFFYALKL